MPTRKLMVCIILFYMTLQKTNEYKDLKALELKHDPTHFSDISQRYQEIVQFLINCNIDDLPPGGTADMLDHFRVTYLATAFICRYRNCPRFSDGFNTASARDEHERGHIKPLRCADPSCDLFDRGFNSRTGLIKHNRKFHPKPEDAEPPTFESISAPAPVFVPPPPPPPPSPPRRPPSPPRQPTPPPKEQEPKRRAEKVKKIRVSRAKRGKPVHNCPRCPKVCFAIPYSESNFADFLCRCSPELKVFGRYSFPVLRNY